MDYRNRITIKPGKHSGKPCIHGMRMTAYDVLDYLVFGMTPAEILADFPYLTADDIQACLLIRHELNLTAVRAEYDIRPQAKRRWQETGLWYVNVRSVAFGQRPAEHWRH